MAPAVKVSVAKHDCFGNFSSMTVNESVAACAVGVNMMRHAWYGGAM